MNNFRKWAGDQFTISVRRGSRHLDDRTSALNGAVEAGGSGDVALQPAGTSLRRSASDISPPSATDAEGNPGAENNAPNDSSPATDAPRHRPCTRRPPRRPSAARTAMVANPSPASTWPRHPLDLLGMRQMEVRSSTVTDRTDRSPPLVPDNAGAVLTPRSRPTPTRRPAGRAAPGRGRRAAPPGRAHRRLPRRRWPSARWPRPA